MMTARKAFVAHTASIFIAAPWDGAQPHRKGRHVNLDKRLDPTDVPGSVEATLKSTNLAHKFEAALVIDHALRVVSAGMVEQSEIASSHTASGLFTTGSAYWDARLRQLIAAGSPVEMHPCADDSGRTMISVMPIASLEGTSCQRQAIVVFRHKASPQDNISAIRDTFGLTATETEVLRYIYKGLSTVEVARTLGIANSTARTHLSHIFDKTSTSRQSELVYFVATFL